MDILGLYKLGTLLYYAKFKRLINLQPWLWTDCQKASKQLYSPLRAFAFAEAVLTPDTTDKGEDEFRSPLEVLLEKKANVYEYAHFIAYMLKLNKFIVNIYSIGENARKAESQPEHYLVIARNGFGKYVSIEPGMIRIHGDKPDSILRHFMSDVEKVVVAYDYTGERILFTYVPGETPWRIADDYEPDLDFA